MRPLWTLTLLVACKSGKSVSDDESTAAGQDTGAATTGWIATDVHSSCNEDEGVIRQSTAQDHNGLYNNGFSRMTSVSTPSGEVLIFAQDEVNDTMVYRARNLMGFFLTDAPGTTYGEDKSAVAEAMSDNNALLVLPNGEHDEDNEYPWGQPLYEDENPPEGSNWYLNNNYNHRDAGFEEIFHLVHDTGIGTYLPGALPEYQEALEAEAEAALKDGRWGIAVDPGVEEWIDELRWEGSLAQEYIASVIDSYYGLWAAWDEDDGGMWGIYIAKTREEVAEYDPAGMAQLEMYLTPYLTFEARLDPDLDQTFSLEFDESEPYTHKSQYLLHATLTGTNDAGLIGNDQDNTLRGNSGDNTIDGRTGTDTMIYCDVADAYVIEATSDGFSVDGPEGSDALIGVERIHFADGILELSSE